MTDKIKYTIFIVLFIGMVILIDLLSPRKINWNNSFSKNDKIPFGCYVLYNQLAAFFPNQAIRTVDLNFYEFEIDTSDYAINYIVINDNYDPGEIEADEMIYMVSEGSTALIAASDISNDLADTLGIRLGTTFSLIDSLEINFSKMDVAKKIRMTAGKTYSVISQYDTARTEILAYDREKRPVLVKLNFDYGFIIFCSIPMAFTNYELLNSDASEFVSHCLNQLPLQSVYWDEYYKAGGSKSGTVLRFILYRDPLKWAYWLTISILTTYILFQIKRRQRIIPVIQKVKNSTLDFLDVISMLYLYSRNHKTMAEKRIIYFQEMLRNRWFLSSDMWQNPELISLKTGYPKEKLELLFTEIQIIRRKDSITENELISLNNHLENFYKTTK